MRRCHPANEFAQKQVSKMSSDITKDPEVRRLFYAAYEEAASELKNHPANNSIGFTPIIAKRAREILRERHGIELPEPQIDPMDRVHGNMRN
jgi:hypothetical protein